MKLLTAVSAAALVASTLVIGVAQWHQAAAASGPPPYFQCAAGTLCVEPLQFRSQVSELFPADNAEFRTSTVYNYTAGPVTISGIKFVNDSLPGRSSFGVESDQTCIGRTLKPGEECSVDISAFPAEPETATLEVDATAGGPSGPAVIGTATVQGYMNIQPDNDLTTNQQLVDFSADHVGEITSPLSLPLTGFGYTPPPPVHLLAAANSDPSAPSSGFSSQPSSGLPAGATAYWYRVTGATVVQDLPSGFPAEYQVDISDCAGKAVNIQAATLGGGSASCNVSVIATPYSDGIHEAILDISYCTVTDDPQASCPDAPPRHVLTTMRTTVPWNPGPCHSLCVEPLTFLPVDSDSGKPFDPVLVRTSTVYNGSGVPLTITDDSLFESDGVFDIYAVDSCLGATLPPGGECGVSVRLHDDGNPHLRTQLVVNATTAGICVPTDGGPPCKFRGMGSVTSRPSFTDRDTDMWADPAALDVGSGIVGTTTAPKTVTLAGWAWIPTEAPHPQWDRVMSVQVRGPQAADFKADFSDCANKDVNIEAGTKYTAWDFTLAGVPSCKVSVTATPSGTGIRQASLDVTYCTVDVDPEDNVNYRPQPDCFDSKTPRHVLVGLTALGLAAPPPPPTGCHALCVEPLDFLPTPTGTDPTKVRTSTVFNGTGAPVTVTAESFVNGANRFDVYPSETCIGHTLPAGGECAVSVRYSDDGVAHPSAALKVDGVHPGSGAAVTGQGAITVGTAAQPDNDLYAVPPLLDFGNQPVGVRSGPLSVTLTGWGATAKGPVWYRVLDVSVFGNSGAAQPADYHADGSDCADKALNLKADPATGFLGTRSCTISVTDLPPSPGVRPAGLDITYCEVSSASAPCDGTTTPGHVLVGLTANGTRPTFQPKLTAAPAVSPAGRVIHITGSRFPANASFVLSLTPLGTPTITDPAILAKQPLKASGRTDSSGNFSVDLLIMPNTAVGTHPLQATAVDALGNQGSAQIGFLVTPESQEIVPGAPPTVLPRH